MLRDARAEHGLGCLRLSSINLYAKEISVKVVYYGPGLGGKTRSLQYIHRTIKPDSRGQLVSLATGMDRTLYFDFLPVKLPKLRGFAVRVQLYTVPGQVHYNSTRKLVLTGADGVVFVADSQRDRREANIESLNNLVENLQEQGTSLDKVPHLFQYNKRDVPELLTVAELEADLNRHRAPFFETCATNGRGVFEALKSVTTLVLTDLRRRGLWRAEQGAAPPPPTAPAIATPAPATFAELREEPSDPQLTGKAPTDGSISASLQALTEREEVREVDELSLKPLRPEDLAETAPRGDALSSILPPGAARDAIVRVEYLMSRGDYARAVLLAAQIFDEAARAGAAVATTGHEGPALHALMLGIEGERYLRFRTISARAASGAASSADATFALFFLVDAALRTKSPTTA
jgi:signal recognition particle receptor subunit beta